MIHGPQRSGKTVNARAFRQHYGCARVLDWWAFRRTCAPSQDGDLLLTTEALEVILHHLPDATVIPINAARRAIGLEPVPAEGFPVVPEVRPADPAPIVVETLVGLGIVLPLSVGTDGEIVDATGAALCVVDHNREISDERVARISVAIVRAVNAYEAEVTA